MLFGVEDGFVFGLVVGVRLVESLASLEVGSI